MGGNQSWLACDSTYPEDVSHPQEAPDASLLVAVLIFVMTLLIVFTATCIGHCLFINFKRRRRHREPGSRVSHQQGGAVKAAAAAFAARKASLATFGAATSAGSGGATNLAVVTELQSVSEESGSDGEDDDDENFTDSDIDSATDRDMRQLAASRRFSTLPQQQNAGIQDQPGPGVGGTRQLQVGYDNRGFV